jgi:hypothetical protein
VTRTPDYRWVSSHNALGRYSTPRTGCKDDPENTHVGVDGLHKKDRLEVQAVDGDNDKGKDAEDNCVTPLSENDPAYSVSKAMTGENKIAQGNHRQKCSGLATAVALASAGQHWPDHLLLASLGQPRPYASACTSVPSSGRLIFSSAYNF